jgi:hypothetical protein
MLHDPKKLQETIELDYVQRPGRRRRGMRIVQWSTFAISLGFVAWTWLPAHRSVYQADSVSVAHTMFNQDCSACHDRPFAPLGRLFGGDAGHPSVLDSTCTSCHAGAAHHPPKNKTEVMATDCVKCHREHRGQPKLAHVANQQCTACHRHIKSVQPNTKLEDVSDLFSAHPEFALWRHQRQDEGTVHFNHVKHLNLVPEDFRNRKDFRSLVSKLQDEQCNYCHRVDPAGRYMLPIRYDSHCKNCHPLVVPLTGKWQDEGLQKAAAIFTETPLPHPATGQGPSLVWAVARDRYLDFVQRNPQVVGKPILVENVRPFPGKGTIPLLKKDQLDWANQQMKDAETMLFNGADGCRRCHQEVKGQEVWRPNGLPDYGKPNVPRRWLFASQFNHHSHRQEECVHCHEGAATSAQTKDVLMPKIDTCRQCHHPNGGARTACFECHTFHARQDAHKDLPWPSK